MKEGELFMPFAPNTRSRSWMVTIQVANMENAGLTKEEYENAELLANFMIETWEHSGKDRTAGISVCRSKEGLYHCHMACYGNTTTLKKVSDIENIYFATDFENGGLDYYIENGAPEILFLDEFKGNMKFSQLLVLLDKYSRAQLHCRYSNCFCLWTTVVITSVFPPDEVYTYMVDDAKKKRDRVEQLLRRLDEIWYKYKENGVYKTYKIPAEEYIDYDDLKSRASKDGFVPVDEYENIPFDS